jgi:hypothetical protein
LLVLLWCAGLACSGQSTKDPDRDGTKEQAQAFTKNEPTKDSLNVNSGDRQDWRFYQAEQTGTVRMKISRSQWDEYTISGYAMVFSDLGKRVTEKAFPGEEDEVVVSFDVEKGRRYWVQFKAKKGKGQYAVELGFGDACEGRCSSNQNCVSGQCVGKAKPRRSKVRKASPKCPPGHVRRGGKCKVKVGDVHCSVVDARSAGGGSLITLSAGDNKKVKVGSKGSIRGVSGSSFTVIAVYPTRCKAKCKAGLNKILSGGAKKAVIRP